MFELWLLYLNCNNVIIHYCSQFICCIMFLLHRCYVLTWLFMIISRVTIIADNKHCGLVVFLQDMLFCKIIGQFLYNKKSNAWMLGNIKCISHVGKEISLVCFAHSWDILVNTRNRFPNIHVLFSISFFRLIFIKRRNIYILQRQRWLFTTCIH